LLFPFGSYYNILFIENLFQTLQTPKYTVEIKELNVDISKDGGSKSSLLVRLQILPILVHIGEPRDSCDQLSNLGGGGCSSSCQASFAAIERSSAPFICEKFSISCEFGHDRYISSFYSFFFFNINMHSRMLVVVERDYVVLLVFFGSGITSLIWEYNSTLSFALN
jgi:hypothetical protein